MITEEKVGKKKLDKLIENYGVNAILVGRQSSNTAFLHTGSKKDLPIGSGAQSILTGTKNGVCICNEKKGLYTRSNLLFVDPFFNSRRTAPSTMPTYNCTHHKRGCGCGAFYYWGSMMVCTSVIIIEVYSP